MADPIGDIHLERGGTIPAWELVERFVLASGPGGQNVNKVATAVELRWSPSASSLDEAIKTQLQRRLAKRLTQEGELIIQASAHRSQILNREDARRRLKAIVDAALKPRKRRIATRPTRGSIERRLKAKSRRSEIKAARGKVERDD